MNAMEWGGAAAAAALLTDLCSRFCSFNLVPSLLSDALTKLSAPPPRQEVCTSLGWRSANLIYAPQPYLRVAANSDQVVTASDYMLIIIA